MKESISLNRIALIIFVIGVPLSTRTSTLLTGSTKPSTGFKIIYRRKMIRELNTNQLQPFAAETKSVLSPDPDEMKPRNRKHFLFQVVIGKPPNLRKRRKRNMTRENNRVPFI